MPLPPISEAIAIVAVIIGTFFSVVGVIGYLRLPDALSRLHATGKVGVFGAVFLLIAAAVATPLGWGESLILIFFLMVTGPVTAHAIGSAAYRIGLRPKNAVRDDLAALVNEKKSESKDPANLSR